MPRVRFVPEGLLAAALLCSLAGSARSQAPVKPLGIPRANGVPGFTGPPDWTAAAPPLAKLIDDPRWVGAAGVSHGGSSGNAGNQGSGSLADFRAIQTNEDTLYLSWMVRFDPRVWGTMDRVYVGLAHPDKNAAAPAVLLSIKLSTESPLVASTSAANRDVKCYTRTAAGGWTAAAVGTFPWADSAAVWINDPNGRSDKAENNGTFWAIHVKVPVLKNAAAADVPTKGVPADADGKLLLWYECQNWFGTSVDPQVHQMAFPSGSAITTPAFIDTPANLAVPDPYAPEGKWALARLKKDTDNAADFSNTGIDIAWADVGVLKNVAAPLPAAIPANLGHEIQFPKTVNDPAVTNLFVARPTNGTAAPIPAQKLQARFRIANWGSQIGFANPGDALWETLKADNGAVPVNADDIPVYDPVQNKKGEIRLYWQAKPTDPLVQDFMGPTPKRSKHQCVLFEMAGNGANFPFIRNSIYKNMDFVDASLFTRTAAISVAGLPAVADGAAKRDVFLLVRTFGMPARVGGPVPPPEAWPTPTPKSPGPVSVPVLPPKDAPPRDVPRVAKEGQPGLAGKEPRDKTPYPDAVVRSLGVDPDAGKPNLPSYTVFAWHDTGRTLTVDGVKARVVEPQTAFGYYVTHNGPLDGWRHALKGAEKIGPDFYKVSPPTGGSVDVVTEIEAMESPVPPPCPCPPVCVPHCPPPVCLIQPLYYQPCPPPAARPRLFRR